MDNWGTARVVPVENEEGSQRAPFTVTLREYGCCDRIGSLDEKIHQDMFHKEK